MFEWSSPILPVVPPKKLLSKWWLQYLWYLPRMTPKTANIDFCEALLGGSWCSVITSHFGDIVQFWATSTSKTNLQRYIMGLFLTKKNTMSQHFFTMLTQPPSWLLFLLLTIFRRLRNLWNLCNLLHCLDVWLDALHVARERHNLRRGSEGKTRRKFPHLDLYLFACLYEYMCISYFCICIYIYTCFNGINVWLHRFPSAILFFLVLHGLSHCYTALPIKLRLLLEPTRPILMDP